MYKKVCVIQEIVSISQDAFADGINSIADFIDSEIAIERRGIDDETIKVDSVAIVYNEVQFPFAHSGEEFRGFVKRLHEHLWN